MNKKFLLLAPFALLAIVGCPSSADSGDSGIEQVKVDPSKSPSGASNPAIPGGMKSAIPGGK